jgi:tetratricopeptide (TPR) repeat protein
VAIAIALLVAIVYAPVIRHDFVSLDDATYFVSNPNLDGHFEPADALRAFRFYFANWIPLTHLSIAIDNALYGTDPTGPLVTNAVLHAIASLLVFLALQRMSLGIAVPAFVAAVFAVHPLHVESVAWASSRKDVLMGVGWAAAMLAYAVHRERRSALRQAMLFAAAAAAMLAKPAAVTLPFALLLLDFWPLRRFAQHGASEVRAAVVEKLPLFAMSGFVSAMAVAAQTGAGAHASMRASFPHRLINAGAAYAAYAIDALWPSGLAVHYPYDVAGLTSGASLASCAGVALLTAFALRAAASRPHLCMGWLWFLGTLVPMIGLVQVGLQARADRYMYLPLIGLTLAVGWEAREVALRSPTRRRALAAAGVAAVLALAIAAHRQVLHWSNSEALFEHAIAVTRDNAVVQSALGRVLYGAGDLAGAERLFLESLRIRPQSDRTRSELGLVYLDQGRIAEARVELERALVDGAEPAVTHSGLGVVAERSGDAASAVAHYRAALRADPQRVEAANNLAWILATASEPALRNPAEAIALAERVAREKPGDPSVLDTLAAAYAAAERYEDAAATQARAVAALAPGASPLRADLESRLERYRARAR